MKRPLLFLAMIALITFFHCCAAFAADVAHPTHAPTPTARPTPSPTPLARGASGDGVRALQQKLNEYGFTKDEPDGVFGASTAQNIKELQRYLHIVAHETPSPWAGGPKPFLADIQIDAPEEDAFYRPLRPSPFEEEEIEDAPFEPSGVLNEEQLAAILDGEFSVYRRDLIFGERGMDVERLQTRLNSLGYMDGDITGALGTETREALIYFQQVHGLDKSGIADMDTQLALYSAEAKHSDRPMFKYYLKIDISKQRVFAYEWDNDEYSKLTRTMICSTGLDATPTPKGIFTSGGPAAKWCYFPSYGCWAQYAYRIEGTIFFHSVLYSEANEATLRQGSVDKLGQKASHGCVRLSLEDARWIYENCKTGTIVEVF